MGQHYFLFQEIEPIRCMPLLLKSNARGKPFVWKEVRIGTFPVFDPGVADLKRGANKAFEMTLAKP